MHFYRVNATFCKGVSDVPDANPPHIRLPPFLRHAQAKKNLDYFALTVFSMTRVRSLFLCAVLALPFVLPFGWLTGRLFVVREGVSRRLEEGSRIDSLCRLSFQTAELSRVLVWEHSREFRFQGRMYDVVQSEIRGDSTIFWCHPDVIETSLRREIRNLLVRALGDGNEQIPSPVRHLAQFYWMLVPPAALKPAMLTGFPGSHRPAWEIERLPRGVADSPPSPPPRAC